MKARCCIVLVCMVLSTSAAFASAPPASRLNSIHVLDVRPLRKLDLGKPDHARTIWDTMHGLAALQGIVNRSKPRFYLLHCKEFGVETDEFWLGWYRGEDGWLAQTETQQVADYQEAVRLFKDQIRGLVVYDEAVPATANLASTAAATRDLMPVRFSTDPNSAFAFCTGNLGLPVKLWLVNPDGTSKFTGRGIIPNSAEPSTGSAKNDAYRWAIREFIQSGECDPRFIGYFIDAFWLQLPRQAASDMHTLANHDYFVAHRGFFFDLSPWADETPNDDPNQRLGLDRDTMFLILRALNARAPNSMIKLGGFTPWPYKYTDHRGVGGKHGGVPTEWEFARLISEFNGYMEADAAGLASLANASFNQHYPLKPRYAQPNPRPTKEQWHAAGHLTVTGKVAPKLFVGHYVGDYDAPSWLSKAVAAWSKDKERGAVPLGWAFNPNLMDRAPQALAFAYRHATSNDFFIAGDSGAGYVNPRALRVRPHSNLPSALETWARHCEPYYRRWDMTITGFVLDGAAGRSNDPEFTMYRRLSPDGCGTHFEPGPRMILGIPTCPERDLPDSAEEAAKLIARKAAEVKGEAKFLWARSILKSPSWYARVSRLLAEQHPAAKVAVVDPYTFFGLVRQAQSQ